MKLQAVEEVTGGTLDRLLGYHLRRASIRDIAGFAKAADGEVTMVQFTVLSLINEMPGITAAEIGRQVGIQRANIAPMLAEFDRRDLIERRADRQDHRVQRLHLSPAGEEALAGWQTRISAQEEETFAALKPAERETLRRLLARIWQED